MESPRTQDDQVFPLPHNDSRHCPHCGHALTVAEAIEVLHGSGWEEYVPIRLRGGRVEVLEVGLVNPRLVEVLS